MTSSGGVHYTASETLFQPLLPRLPSQYHGTQLKIMIIHAINTIYPGQSATYRANSCSFCLLDLATTDCHSKARGGLRSLMLYLMLPAHFWFFPIAPFSNFHCSFFISLFSLPPLFFLLLPSDFLCCLLLFTIVSCPLLPFQFLCSLLSDYQFHAPCSIHYFMPCSLLPWVSKRILPAPRLISPNRGSILHS